MLFITDWKLIQQYLNKQTKGQSLSKEKKYSAPPHKHFTNSRGGVKLPSYTEFPDTGIGQWL